MEEMLLVDFLLEMKKQGYQSFEREIRFDPDREIFRFRKV